MYIQLRFEWDDTKNRSNQRKHRVSFEFAARVFEDPNCLFRADRVDATGEQRWHAIGLAKEEDEPAVLLLVVHVVREEYHG